MAGGRPNKYFINVKPRFEEIKGWIEEGATDKEIAKMLGINKSTLVDYKNKYSEFSELMKNTRILKITELKNALFKKAMGFQYTETETITDYDGSVKTKKTIKTSPPSETAILILLKHWDKNADGTPKWANDPATLQLKYKEYELKKEQAEDEKW